MFTFQKYITQDGKMLYKMLIEVIMEVTFISLYIFAFPVVNFAQLQNTPRNYFPILHPGIFSL